MVDLVNVVTCWLLCSRLLPQELTVAESLSACHFLEQGWSLSRQLPQHHLNGERCLIPAQSGQQARGAG